MNVLCLLLHKNFQNCCCFWFGFALFCCGLQLRIVWWQFRGKLIRAHRTCRISLFSDFLRNVLITMNNGSYQTGMIFQKVLPNVDLQNTCNRHSSVRLTAVGKSRETSMAACASARHRGRHVHPREREQTLRALTRLRRALQRAQVHAPRTPAQMPGT